MKDAIYIPTGMYANDTEKILKALVKAMEKSWQIQTNFRCAGLQAISFERAPDNEILLKLSSDDGYGRTWRFWSRIVKQSFYDRANNVLASEQKAVLEKLGWNIKLFARGIAIRDLDSHATDTDAIEFNPSPKYDDTWRKKVDMHFKKRVWKRNGGLKVKPFLSENIIEDFNLRDVNITIGDLYFLYEKLIGRLEKSAKRYDSAVVHRLVGEPRDVISTEAEVARREEIARITEEYAAKIDDLETTYSYAGHKHRSAYDELQRIINEFKNKCKEKQNELRVERDAKIAEVNAACQFLTV